MIDVDDLLEAAAARRVLAYEDEVELAAARCMQAYKLLGGELLTLPAWRARVRELLLSDQDHSGFE